ncbi:MAG: phage tail tape measure C-terminal domain-containing protein [Alphaproteobacteria bacterium]
MPRRTVENVSIRISVDGGGKAVAEITEFGQKGEKSVRKMEVASKDASKGLGGLVERAKNLKLAAVALTGVLAAGGLAGALYAMTRRAIESADAIGKTADKLGISTDALQEYRFAAEQAGVSQETFDATMQRFTRRAAEAAKGTGEAKDALKQMGIELLDQNGNMRASEDLLLDVADAFKNTADSSERLRLASKLFDSEGAALINMLTDGSDALEEMREEARRLGIVIDETLIRDAEKAQDKLEAVNKVVSAQMTKAFLSLAPLISDAATEFAEFAGFAQDVGVAYEKMKLFFSGDFDFSGLSESTIESQFRRYKMQVEELQAALAQIGDPNGFWEWNEWATLRTQLDQAYGSYETYAERYLNLQKQIIAGTDEATAEQIQSAQELESAFEKTIQGQGVANNLRDGFSAYKELEDQIRQTTEEVKKIEEEERLLELYEKELITFETYKKGLEEINGKIQDVEEAQEEANKTFAGAAKAGLQRYIDEAADLYDVLEALTYQSMKTLEDILVNTALTGKFEWKDMVNSMIADLTRLIIQATITRPLAQGLMGLFGDGAAFSGGQVTAFAKGGIVGGPTIFPMANGMGLMGEDGPEAVMPLARTNNGKLGVYISGDAGGSRNHYTVNVDARGSSDPGATSAAVERAVDAALNARIPGIVQASADLARRQVVDNYQRRGNSFD